MYNALAFVKSISNFFDELTWWQTELIFLLRIAIGVRRIRRRRPYCCASCYRYRFLGSRHNFLPQRKLARTHHRRNHMVYCRNRYVLRYGYVYFGKRMRAAGYYSAAYSAHQALQKTRSALTACAVLQLRRAAKNTANVFRHNAIPPLQNHARGQSFGSRSRYTPQPKLSRGENKQFYRK